MFYEVKNSTDSPGYKPINRNIIKNGVRYAVYTSNEKCKVGMRFLKGTVAFFATLLSLGTALSSQKIRNYWQSALVGRVKYYIPDSTTQEKIREITAKFTAFDPSSLEPASQEIDLQNLKLDDNEIELLSNSLMGRKLDGCQRIQGGESVVVLLKSRPGIVFKMDSQDCSWFGPRDRFNEKDIEKYNNKVKTIEKAREVIQKNNLNKLKVPQTSVLRFKEGYPILAQEKVDVSGGFHDLRGIHLYGLENDSAREQLLEGYRQLVKFICLTGFSDVKHDNTPYLPEIGKIALYDLDEIGFITGLFTGRAGGKDGALKYAPTVEFLDELVGIVRETLKEDENKLKQFEEIWNKEESEIKNKIIRRAEKRKDRKERLETKGIDSSALIDGSKKSLNKLEKLIVKEINNQLSQKANIDPIENRKVEINLRQPPAGLENYGKSENLDKIFKSLDSLKEKGLIFEWRKRTRQKNPAPFAIRIYC